MTELPATLGMNKPVKSTRKSLIKETWEAFKTYLVNKAVIACMTIIQRKRPLVTQKIYGLNTLQHRPERQQKATKGLKQQN